MEVTVNLIDSRCDAPNLMSRQVRVIGDSEGLETVVVEINTIFNAVDRSLTVQDFKFTNYLGNEPVDLGALYTHLIYQGLAKSHIGLNISSIKLSHKASNTPVPGTWQAFFLLLEYMSIPHQRVLDLSKLEQWSQDRRVQIRVGRVWVGSAMDDPMGHYFAQFNGAAPTYQHTDAVQVATQGPTSDIVDVTHPPRDALTCVFDALRDMVDQIVIDQRQVQDNLAKLERKLRELRAVAGVLVDKDSDAFKQIDQLVRECERELTSASARIVDMGSPFQIMERLYETYGARKLVQEADVQIAEADVADAARAVEQGIKATFGRAGGAGVASAGTAGSNHAAVGDRNTTHVAPGTTFNSRSTG